MAMVTVTAAKRTTRATVAVATATTIVTAVAATAKTTVVTAPAGGTNNNQQITRNKIWQQRQRRWCDGDDDGDGGCWLR